MFSSRGLRLLDQCSFFLLKLCRVTCLDESHVIHLELNLANADLGVTDVGLSLPVGKDSNQVFLSSLKPVLHRSLNDRFLVILGSEPLLPPF